MIVSITDDLDLKKIENSGQCFRCKDLGDTYRFMTGKNVLYISPCGENIFDVSAGKKEWDRVWAPYFDLERDYISIRALAADDFMRKAAECGRGIRILKQDPWETLVSFIISQRKNIPAIKSCVEALCRLCGEKIHTDREELFSFPDAAAVASLSADDLSSLGLGYRAPYIEDAANAVSQGYIRLEEMTALSDEELFNSLKAIKGVGDKVASCVMLFAYSRTAFAPVDTWIKKVIEGRYGGRNVFLDYGKNAGIMQQYVFYYAQTHKETVNSYIP